MSAHNLTIAENQQKVYDAGYAAGQAEGGGGLDLGRVCNQILLTDLNLLGAEDVVLNLDKVTRLTTLVDFGVVPNTTVKHLTVNCQNTITDAQRMFAGADSYLERVTFNVDFSKAALTSTFWNMQNLQVIDGAPMDLSGMRASNYFPSYLCPKLREVRVVPGSLKVSTTIPSSTVLSAESKQSIVDGLADLTGQATQTLTLHANIALTDDQKATISSKNWTLVQ